MGLWRDLKGWGGLDREGKLCSASVEASAKINLTLRVLGRRDDGYHDLRSLVIGAGLYDTVCCAVGGRPGIEVECNLESLCGRSNLAFAAAKRLAEQLDLKPSVRIRIEKNIPLGAGLGGGSSDAASTLRLCNQQWGGTLFDTDLAAVGSEIGSDVPLFFSLPCATMSGRGERVQRTEFKWSGWVLLVFAGVLVPTVDVYRAWRRADDSFPRGEPESAVAVSERADELQQLAFNDLEPAVFRVAPKVFEVKEALDRRGWGPTRVSGAGSTLYRLFDEQASAFHAAAEIRRLGIADRVEVVAAPVGPQSLEIKES